MSNPLLQPDGRFRRESVLDAEGRNRFSDGEETSDATPREFLAPPGDASQPAYQPQFAQAYEHRGAFVATLGAAAFGMTWLLLLAFTDYLILGLAAAGVGIALSIATLVIGFHDLSGMANGAVDREGRGLTLLGFRLALSGLLLGIGGVIFVVWMLIRGFFELF